MITIRQGFKIETKVKCKFCNQWWTIIGPLHPNTRYLTCECCYKTQMIGD